MPPGKGKMERSVVEKEPNDQGHAHTIQSRQGLRRQLEEHVEAFLNAGGHIEQIDMHVTAYPPTKPVSRYGGLFR